MVEMKFSYNLLSYHLRFQRKRLQLKISTIIFEFYKFLEIGKNLITRFTTSDNLVNNMLCVHAM